MSTLLSVPTSKMQPPNEKGVPKKQTSHGKGEFIRRSSLPRKYLEFLGTSDPKADTVHQGGVPKKDRRLPPNCLEFLGTSDPKADTVHEGGVPKKHRRLPPNCLEFLGVSNLKTETAHNEGVSQKETPNERGKMNQPRGLPPKCLEFLGISNVKTETAHQEGMPKKQTPNEKGKINQRRELPPQCLEFLGISNLKTETAHQEDSKTETKTKRMRGASYGEPRSKHNIVRKQLFKVPPKFNNSLRTIRSSTSFKASARSKSIKNDFRNLAVPLPSDRKENLAFNFEAAMIQSPVHPFGRSGAFTSSPINKFESNKKKTPLKSTLSTVMETRDSTSSTDSEFLALENKCEMSPIMSMCNLLSNTSIGSSKKLKTKNENLNIEDSIRMIKEIRENCIKFHEENMLKINTILENLEGNLNLDNKDNIPRRISPRLNAKSLQTKSPLKVFNSPKISKGDNKENIPTRISPRLNAKSLQTKSPLKVFNSPKISKGDNKENIPTRISPRLNAKSLQTKSPLKVFNSPKICKGDNLRKATLTKNLSKSLQNLETPRTKKALEMYNSLRKDNDILTTPNFKNIRDKDVRLSDSLSLIIQNQCLMLQDTPLK